MLETYGQRTTPAQLGKMAVRQSTRGHDISPVVLTAPWSKAECAYVQDAISAIIGAQESSAHEMWMKKRG
jgi:hypothetical protein